MCILCSSHILLYGHITFTYPFFFWSHLQLVLYVLYRKYYEGEEIKERAAYSLLGIMQILRLLRINRVDSLTKSSVAIQTWWVSWSLSPVALCYVLGQLRLMHFATPTDFLPL